MIILDNNSRQIEGDIHMEIKTKIIANKIVDTLGLFVNLGRSSSLTGHSFTYHENIRQRSKINNVKIKADKGAIVQTGSDQYISDVNNRSN